MTDYMPRKDVELPPRMPEAAIIAELRAELDRLRADAQAAVSLHMGMVENRAREWAGNYPQGSDGRNTFVMFADWVQSQAPADGLAAVEALRKERDDAVAAAKQQDALRGATLATMRSVSAENDRLAAELAAAQQREARRTFPILKGDGAKIDYQLVADHAGQARSNHGQSVDRLAARGGLSWCELYAVLHNRKWEKVDTNEAMIACRSLEARYLAALSHNGRKAE